MSRVSAGDHDAFNVLVRRHIDAVYRYALRLTRSPSDAEDLVQDTMLTMWRKAASFNARKAQLNTWLHRVAHNRYVDTQRRQRLPLDETIDVDQVAEQMDGTSAATGTHDMLLHLIDGLPLNQRSAIALTHLQGMSNKEAAHILGISVRATESLLARARSALRAAVVDSKDMEQYHA